MSKAVAAVAVLALGLLFAPAPAQAQNVLVPDLAGMTREQAVAALIQLRLNPLVLQDAVSSDPAQAERVASQEPRAGAQLPRGSQVVLHLYRGVARVTVPNVIGMDRASAAAALNRAGLGDDRADAPGRAAIPDTERTGDPAKIGKVLRQDPSAGAQVPKGKRVRLIIGVSEGRPLVRVPDVVGMSVMQAEDTLRRAGFVTQRVDPPVPAAGPGKVLTVARQEPVSGRDAALRSVVQIWAHERPPRR